MSISEIDSRLHSLQNEQLFPKPAQESSTSQQPVRRGQVDDFVRAIRSAADLQLEFQVIPDGVQSVYLPSEYCVRTQRQGLQRAEWGSMSIIQRCAKYFEVTLKILSVSEADLPLAQCDLDDLTTIQFAATKYPQDEVAFGVGLRTI